MIEILPSETSGTVAAPPSKSAAHRMLIAAALSENASVVKGISGSDDMAATLSCIRALGVPYERKDDEVLFGPHNISRVGKARFDCGESGSTLRFFIPIAARYVEESVFSGSERLIERGIDVYEKVFSEKAVGVEKTAAEIRIKGKLTAGNYVVSGNVSSQYVSGLLFALPLMEGKSTLRVTQPVESRPYIDLTLEILKRSGIKIEESERNFFRIDGGQKYVGGEYETEGDWSNGAALLAFNEIGGKIKVTGLNPFSAQGDKVCTEAFGKLNDENPVIDVSDCPDLAPVLFAVAAMKNGAKFTGTKRLKIKESDRASAMAEELYKCGINTLISENSVVVGGGAKRPREVLSGHNDHRIIMALTVLLSKTGGFIEGENAVKKSYPDFFKDIAKIGVKINEIKR